MIYYLSAIMTQKLGGMTFLNCYTMTLSYWSDMPPIDIDVAKIFYYNFISLWQNLQKGIPPNFLK